MIDRSTRDRFAELLRHFVAGLIYNDEFEDRLGDILPEGYPRNWPEPFLWMMYGMAWTLYDDIRKAYKLRGEDEIPREGRRNIARWIMFLYSDREYEGPQFDFFMPAGCLATILTLGFAEKRAWRIFLSEIDQDLW